MNKQPEEKVVYQLNWKELKKLSRQLKNLMISDLIDNIEKFEIFFREAPVDYGDRKDLFEELLQELLKGQNENKNQKN